MEAPRDVPFDGRDKTCNSWTAACRVAHPSNLVGIPWCRAHLSSGGWIAMRMMDTQPVTTQETRDGGSVAHSSDQSLYRTEGPPKAKFKIFLRLIYITWSCKDSSILPRWFPGSGDTHTAFSGSTFHGVLLSALNSMRCLAHLNEPKLGCGPDQEVDVAHAGHAPFGLAGPVAEGAGREDPSPCLPESLIILAHEVTQEQKGVEVKKEEEPNLNYDEVEPQDKLIPLFAASLAWAPRRPGKARRSCVAQTLSTMAVPLPLLCCFHVVFVVGLEHSISTGG